MTRMHRWALSVCAAALWLYLAPSAARAQETVVVQAEPGAAVTKVIQSSPSQVVQQPAQPGQPTKPGSVPSGYAPAGKPPVPGQPGATPGESGRPTPPPGTPGSPGSKEGESSPSVTIKRSDRKPSQADPTEFDARLGPDGRVQFQFRGQNWPDVLEWYAEISGRSVDWQELPGDYLNIATQRGYTADEVGELLNRLLLARGFTMLPQDEFINVVKCEELSASLVPRVRPEDLTDLGDYEFVRVLFELDWMLAEAATAELEPMLSKNGKLYALKTTNRIEAMDAVCNLREIYRLLQEEQKSDDEESRLVREFILKYARADEVKELLTQFVGSDSGTRAMTAGMSPQELAKQQQQMMQMQMQMQQQMARMRSTPSSPSSSRSRTRTPTMPSQQAPVRIMVNPRRNSVLVQAPPDKMATIADAIRLIDVPEQGAQSLQAYLGRMQVYRLAQLDPAKLVETLTQLGGLDPTTRLEVDEANRAIIAYASPADHHTIRMTVEKLDSSARHVEVIPLRRLAADEVAGTIQYLMAGDGDQSSRSRSDYMDYMFGYSSRRSRSEPSTDQFRVDADVENNRLLVRANDVELEEVVSILVKLGEVPQVGRDGEMTRVLDIVPGEETDKFLQRLQRDFKLLAPNKLVLPDSVKPDESAVEPTGPASSADEDTAPTEVEPNPKTVSLSPQYFHTAVLQQTNGEGDAAPPATLRPRGGDGWPLAEQWPSVSSELPGAESAGAPIIVSIGPDGRVVLSSRDVRALDMLEQLATRTAPPTKDYHIFQLEHAPASWVVLNLEDFFEDEDETERRQRDRMSFLFGGPSRGSDADQRRLSKRRPLKFISDLDTNTILVQGADPAQLKTISELIELYDVPEPVSSQNARVTKLFYVKYSRASVIAETIKDAYRDLLSSNDRALQNGGGKQQRQSRSGGMTVISPFGFGGESSPPADNRTSARFEGKLSIGIDDVSNTLLVSTEGENLMEVVGGMIEALDEAAKPVSEVRVVKLSRQVDGARLQEVLQKVLNNQSSPPSKTPAGSGPPGGPPPRPPGNPAAPRPVPNAAAVGR